MEKSRKIEDVCIYEKKKRAIANLIERVRIMTCSPCFARILENFAGETAGEDSPVSTDERSDNISGSYIGSIKARVQMLSCVVYHSNKAGCRLDVVAFQLYHFSD